MEIVYDRLQLSTLKQQKYAQKGGLYAYTELTGVYVNETQPVKIYLIACAKRADLDQTAHAQSDLDMHISRRTYLATEES